jgi:hypothetical protein
MARRELLGDALAVARAFGSTVILQKPKYLMVKINHSDLRYPLLINSDQKYAPPSLLRWNVKLLELVPRIF